MMHFENDEGTIDERQADSHRRRHARDPGRHPRGRSADRGRPNRGDRRPRRLRRRRRADRCDRARGHAGCNRHPRSLRGSRTYRARGFHDRHDVGSRRRLHDDHRASAHVSARHDRGALPRETRHGEREGRRRLRPVGRADRAVDSRDRRPAPGRSGRVQGVHADLGPLLSPRHRRGVPRGDAGGQGGRRARARPRRERFAAAGRPRADAGGGQARRDGTPRGATALRRGRGRAPGALPGRARRRANPDRARLESGQRRPGAS